MSIPIPHRALVPAMPVTPRTVLLHPLALLADWQLRRRIRRELAALPPYLLRDMGLVDQAPPRGDGGRSLDHSRGGPAW